MTSPRHLVEHAAGPVRAGGQAWYRRLLEAAGLSARERLDRHAYREHVALQNRLRIAWLCLVAAVFYPGFGVLDAVVFPDRLGTFMAIRLSVTAAILGYAVVAWWRPAGRLAGAAVLVGCGLSQLGILMMIVLTGGFESSYWVGLLVVYAGYVGFSPHGGGVAAAFFGCVQVAYFAGNWLLVGPPVSSARAIEAMFFLGAGGGLLALVSAFNELNRRQVFLAKLTIARQNLEIERARAERADALERSKAGRLAGRTLGGRYRLAEVLGRGGAGEVYLAEDLELRAPCAVKVLHPELTDSDASIRRFLREAEHASAVASEHVVKIQATGHDDQAGHFLVMEHVPGEDLGALFHRRGTLPPDELLPIIQQIASVLENTHAAGIVHRDLKPKNVLVTHREDGPFIKLIDFGISKMISHKAETSWTAPPSCGPATSWVSSQGRN